MADWKVFYDLYTANFGRLTESDGLKEWAKFVEQEVRDVELLRAALQPYIDRYAAALDNMEPVPKRPTLGQVKRAYFAQCDRLRQEREMRRFGAGAVCGVCYGHRVLFVLAPLDDDSDRRRWPEDFRDVAWDCFRGVELAKCPNCSARYKPELRHRIEVNGLPLTIGRESPDWPAEYDEMSRTYNLPLLQRIEGDKAILSRMQRNR